MSRLIPVVTIYLDTKGGFVAESLEPSVCSRGQTASTALLKLSQALHSATENDLPPRSNVLPFRRFA